MEAHICRAIESTDGCREVRRAGGALTAVHTALLLSVGAV